MSSIYIMGFIPAFAQNSAKSVEHTFEPCYNKIGWDDESFCCTANFIAARCEAFHILASKFANVDKEEIRSYWNVVTYVS